MKNTFKGTPLVKLPEYNPLVGFLQGPFGKEVLEEYKQRVEKDYKNNEHLKALNYNKELDIVQGSNSFAVPIINQILSQEGLNVATHADLERILKTRALPLTGTYVDSAVVLRSEGEPNGHLARNLLNQLKQRDPKIKLPQMINLKDLEVVLDQDSSHGLAFKLKDNAVPIYAPILNENGNFNSEDIDEQTGLPKKLTENGTRRLYTYNKGLCGLYLNRDSDVDSVRDILEYSNSAGRVVVVGGVAAQNFLKRNLP